jgi:hypothetical protein
MQRILMILLVFACATASAQVFKRTGPDGQVYFSDQPGPDAEQVDVTPAQAVTLPPLPEPTDTMEQAGSDSTDPQIEFTAAYTEFSITSPTRDEGVRANDGNVTVHLSLQPALQSGHTIVFNVDGEDGESSSTSSSMLIGLNNMSRGLHTVWATVVDAEGNDLIKTEPVSFYVLRVAVGR